MSQQSFALWLQKQLLRREWRQVDLARRSGISTANISRWMNSEFIPTPDYCDRIADALGVPLDEVLAAAGHRPLDKRIQPDDPRSGLWTIARSVRWTPERTAAVEGLLRSFIAWDAEHGLATKRPDER